jgi:transcription antitermination factor NusG
MSHDVRQWYLVRSKPKQEFRVELNLQAWGVPTLVPKLRELHASRRSPRTEYRVAPLFPSYVFARFHAAQQLAKIRLTRGVQGVVGFGEQATAVDDSVIRVIESRIGEDGYVRTVEPQPGDVVAIVSGPMRSFEGVFERRLCGRDRVLILLTSLGLGARVNVAKADIRKGVAAQSTVPAAS